MADHTRRRRSAATATRRARSRLLDREDLRQGPLARESRARRSRSSSTEAPQIEIGLRTRGEQIDADVYECVLTITVTARVGDKTVFLVEASQAGIFAIRGVAARPDCSRCSPIALPDRAVPVRARDDRRRDDARGLSAGAPRADQLRGALPAAARADAAGSPAAPTAIASVIRGALAHAGRFALALPGAAAVLAGGARAADFRATGDARDGALRRAVGRRPSRCSSTAATCRSRCSSRVEGWTKVRDVGGTIGWIANEVRSPTSAMLVVRVAGRRRARHPRRERRRVVFRAEQNVLLELAETAASPRATGDARLGEGAPPRRPDRLRAHRAGLRALGRTRRLPAARMMRARRDPRRRRVGHRARRPSRARAHARSDVTLWARDAAQRDALVRRTRATTRYLPGVALPDTLARQRRPRGGRAAPTRARRRRRSPRLPTLVDEPAAAGARRAARVAVEGLRRAPHEPAGVRDSRTRCSRRAGRAPVGVVSGPSFAEEVARGLPTALAVAATDAGARAPTWRHWLRGDALRAYDSDDLAGVEVGGAVKNVLAIAAGASDGLGFGHNARAALITRGLAETGRLVAGARRAARHADGPRRPRRPRAHVHRRPVAQSPASASRWRAAKRSPAILARLGHVAEGVRAPRAPRARWPRITASTCRSPRRCIACCTRACRRARAVEDAARARAEIGIGLNAN